MEIKQYDIVLADFNQTFMNSVHKTRPCVILSPDEMNRNLRLVVVAPVTTQTSNYPTRVEIRHDNKSGWVVVDQVSTIDKQRIVKHLGKLSRAEIKKIKAIIKETFVS
jgi:mRNA interferase MazF